MCIRDSCQSARGFLVDVCSGFVYTEVREELLEHYEEMNVGTFSDLARVCVGARNQWHNHRGALMPVPDWEYAALGVTVEPK